MFIVPCSSKTPRTHSRGQFYALTGSVLTFKHFVGMFELTPCFRQLTPCFQGILKQPVLYLSDFFERNRQLYYDNLMRVREKNDLLQWFKFFLVGVIETAKNSIKTFDHILKLQKQVEAQIQTLGSRTANAQKVLHYLYQRPMVNAAKVCKVADISSASAYKLIADLEQFGILKEITGGKRGKMYVFDAYLKLFT